MQRKHVWIALSLLVVAGAGLSSGNAASEWQTSTLIATLDQPVYVQELRTDGRFVAWIAAQAETPATTAARIDVYDTTTGGTPAGGDVGPFKWGHIDIDDGMLVWTTSRDFSSGAAGGVYGRNLLTGEEIVIVREETPGPIGIAGKRVAWVRDEQRAESGTVQVIYEASLDDLAAVPAVVHELSPYGSQVTDLQVGDAWVAWVEFDAVRGRQQLQVKQDAEPPRTILTSEDTIRVDGAGNLLTFAAGGTVGMYKLDTQDIVPGLFGGRHPSTDGRYIFWSNDWLIEGFDERTFSTFVAVMLNETELTDSRLAASDLAGDTLVWVRERLAVGEASGWAAEIHLAQLSDRLPSGRRQPPEVPDPNLLYYPETGHFVQQSVANCIQLSGGLSTFGYPLTEEFSEAGPPIQYFERQRVESYFWDHDTPCWVLLGRLGWEHAEAKGMLHTAPFQPAQADQPPRAGAEYVAVTGHWLSGAFKEYWEQHGLELGGAGTSYLESLMLFGYPVSEEFVDPETGLVTQYFERAIFEQHPDNPPEYQVLLRRLGAEMLDARGW